MAPLSPLGEAVWNCFPSSLQHREQPSPSIPSPLCEVRGDVGWGRGAGEAGWRQEVHTLPGSPLHSRLCPWRPQWVIKAMSWLFLLHSNVF